MANYEEARVKLTNTQRNKSKSAGKNNTWTLLRITKKKNFQDEGLPYTFVLTTRKKPKVRNTAVSAVVKLSKTHLTKIIQSGGFLGKTLGNMMGNLAKKH